MGQLFWKFLLAFWSALAFAIGLIWAVEKLNGNMEPDRRLVFGVQARLLQSSAQTMVDAGGIALLGQVVAKWDLDPMAREQILILDAQGQDYLQRKVPDDWRQLLAKRQTAANFTVQHFRVTDAQGQHWQLLSVPNDSSFNQRLGLWNGSAPEPQPGAIEGAAGKRPPLPPFWFHPLFLMLSVVFTSMASSLLLAWYFAAPVRQLEQALAALPKEQWRTQLGGAITERKDEFGKLARSFNQMAKSVYLAILSQRRLLHDVSHELRSPLARLQILIGLARQQPEDFAAALDKVEAEAMRLDALVGEILTFSRLESGEVSLQQHQVNVTEMLESICDDGQLEAAAQHKQLQLAMLPQIWVQADAEMLYRAFENVIRNAIKYTLPDTLVLVRAEILDITQQSAAANGQPAMVRIWVDDDGPGVPDAELELLFQPFFRSHKHSDGVGLGLSIAKRAVQTCGGTIVAQNRLDHQGQRLGLRLCISLPLSPVGQS